MTDIDTEQQSASSTPSGGQVGEHPLVSGDVSNVPKNTEYFQLVGRYEKGRGDWFAGSLHRNRIDAEADQSTYTYKEARIVRVILPR